MEDLLIRGGTIVDGTGRPRFRGDVSVTHDRITAVGDLRDVTARKTIDADGLIVAPGFIDSHAHSDTSFLRDSSYASMLYQGITTEVSGNCGDSPFPAKPENAVCGRDSWLCTSMDDFLARYEAGHYGMGINEAMLVGHGSLRAAVIGYEDREPTESELREMQALLRREMNAGAFGMSLGLEYSPGFFAKQHELCELGRVVAEFDGLVPCHLRSEGLHLDEALQELFQVGRASGVHVHVSHLKLDNYHVHGRAPEVWAEIEAARKEGVRVTCDMYPFTASATSLTIRCPRWSLEGGDTAVLTFLDGPRREEILDSIRGHYPTRERAATCLFSDGCEAWPEIIGKNLAEVAEMLGLTDYALAAEQVLRRTHCRAQCCFFVMSEADMLYFLSQDIGIGTDGRALSGDPAKVESRPHPRYYAAVSEFFRLAREKKLCSLEEAVRRVTSKPADVFGMHTRGRLLPGKMADIVIFDAAEIGPRSTWLAPVALSKGMQTILISGQIALQNGEQTGLRAGRFLRKEH